MAKLFGFSIENNDEKPKSIVSPVPPNNEDGVDYYIQSGFYGQYVDIEGVYRTEYDLIRRYREMALHPECDNAIESVVNEAIVSDLYDSPVEIELSNLNASDRLKDVIRSEFKYIKEMMDFDKKCHEIFRNWYVDGRVFYLKVIDQKNREAGIQELRYIDPMKIKHVRQEKKLPGNGTNGLRNLNLTSKSFSSSSEQEYNFPEIEEYFIYTPTPNFPSGTISGGSKKGVKIAKDTITYCTSGLVDRNKGTILSYLHKAIKSLNQLRMIEDSLVIYRLCLVGNTRVKTNKGYSYIKDINVGDTVYAYDNRIDKLVETQVSNKWMTGIKQTYKVSSKHHSVVGTDTHPILVFDNVTKDVKYVPIKDLDPKRHHLTYIKPEEDSILTPFPEVREKSYILKDSSVWSSYKIKDKEKIIQELSETTKINKSSIRNFLYNSQSLEVSSVALLQENLEILKDVEFDEKYAGFCRNDLNLPDYIDEEFARLFGFLLGDGSIHKYGVTFAEGVDEIQNLYYSKLMEKFFGNCRRTNSKRKYSNYTTSNTLASELLSKLGFVNGSKNKRIPSWVFTSPNSIKKELILGLLDANGSYRDLVNGFSCEISLENEKLIEDIKEIWTSIGLCSGQIRHRIHPSQSRIVGYEKVARVMPESESWDLYLSEYELPRFEKIQKIESEEIEEVYDIEVSHEKHNFVANGIVVHNSRAPERRIFYIDVGNLPKVKAEQYLKEVMSRYRNKLVYDACLSMDTKVPLLDGRTLTLSQITEEYNRGERLWTYSCDPNTGKFAPGIISWAGVTRRNEKVLRITLDNDKTITCTLDHKFPVWNKGKVEAKDLQIGDSMIPFYSREKADENSTYTQIFENESKVWKYVHHLVSDWKDGNGILNEYTYNEEREDEVKKTVHHINYDRHNNTPENLTRMSKDDHFDHYKQHGNCHPLDKFTCTNLINVCKKLEFNSWKDYKNSIAYKNHKIKNIEFLDETIDVGTLTIDREELYHDYHTFALDAGIYTCNSTGEVRDDRKFMSMLEDFWLPRREGGRGTEITTLPGGQNLGELTDIEYFQKKLYRSLGVPETRIAGGGDGFNLGRSSEILRDELMFSKFVGRLRKRFSNLFNDILRTQLILKNIVSPEDWDRMSDHIQYDFLYDNHFAELKEAELLTNRLTLATTVEPYIGKYYSTEYVRKKILRQTDSEIIEIDMQIEDEIAKGILPNPNAPVDENGNPLPPEQGQDIQQGASGEVPMEPSIDTSTLEIPAPKGGKI